MALIYWAQVTSDETGTGFNVSFPDKPNVSTFGNTVEDALVQARKALNATIEVEIETGCATVKPTYYGTHSSLDWHRLREQDPDFGTEESIACTVYNCDPALHPVPVRADLIPKMRALL